MSPFPLVLSKMSARTNTNGFFYLSHSSGKELATGYIHAHQTDNYSRPVFFPSSRHLLHCRCTFGPLAYFFHHHHLFLHLFALFIFPSSCHCCIYQVSLFFCPSLSSSFICLHNSLIDSDRPLFYQSISVCCGLFYPHPSLHPIPSISPLLLLIKTVCSFEYKMKGKKIRRKNKHKQGQIKR